MKRKPTAHCSFTINFGFCLADLDVETPLLQSLKFSCTCIVQWMSADHEVEVPSTSTSFSWLRLIQWCVSQPENWYACPINN